MARPTKHDGGVFQRPKPSSGGSGIGTEMVSPNGNQPIRQTGQEAQKKLRERLQARDDNTLPVVRKGETLQFGKWADSFLEHYSKPPFRTEKNSPCE